MDKRRLLSAAAMVASLAVAAVTVGSSWTMPEAATGDANTDRYVLLDDGVSRLVKHETQDGTRWESTSIELLPGFRAMTELRSQLADAVAAHVIGKGDRGDALNHRGELQRARIGLVIRRSIEADGSTATNNEVQVLDDRGLFLIGFETVGGDGKVTVFEPALQLLPPTLEVGDRWKGKGTYGSSGYAISGRIASKRGRCLTVESSLELSQEGSEPATYDNSDRYCRGEGSVDGSSKGATSHDHYEVVDDEAPEPPVDAALPKIDDQELDDPSTWELTRIGSALPLGTHGVATFSPTYLPSDPATIVAGTDAGGDVVALRAEGVVGSLDWRLPTAGAVFASPRYDPRTGRLYFGASDGQVRALDRRGLILWSASTNDNVATTPLVVGVVVVAGSEDGHVYGFDADSGEQRWRVDADGAVASSPAAAGGLAIVGDDGGTVTAIDTTDGSVVWRRSMDGAVEAAVTAVDGDVLIADRSGTLTRLDGSTGRVVWSEDAGHGQALRSAVAVLDRVALVVDDLGRLVAVDLTTGEQRWRQARRGYRGSPGVLAHHAAIGRGDGRIDVIDAAGATVRTFDLGDAQGPTDHEGAIDVGLSVGGDALWIADDQGVVRRLGPSIGVARTLAPLWIKTIVDEPFDALSLAHTPAVWSGGMLLLDAAATLFHLDPTTGDATRIAALSEPGDLLLGDPVAVDDVLVLDLHHRIAAYDAASGGKLWSHDVGENDRLRPPAVGDGIVVTVVPDADAAVIQAFDLRTGELRWEVSTGVAALQSAVIIDGGVVYAGAPVQALDAADGRPRWTSTVVAPMGGPAVHADTGVLVVGGIAADGNTGTIFGIDTATGAVSWDRDVGKDAIAPYQGMLATEGGITMPTITGAILGIEPSTGETRWRTALPDPLLGNPGLVDGKVWVATETGQIIELDDQGRITAAFEGLGTSIGGVGLTQRPVAAHGAVVIAAGNIVFAVEASS